jgi:hypothetical protein
VSEDTLKRALDALAELHDLISLSYEQPVGDATMQACMERARLVLKDARAE